MGTSGVHLYQAKVSDPVSRDWAGLPIQVTLSFPSYSFFLNVQWKRATSKSCCKSSAAGETRLLGCSEWAPYSQAMYVFPLISVMTATGMGNAMRKRDSGKGEIH